MSAYSGRYYRGASRDRKIQKREEAEARHEASRARAAEALAAFADSCRAAGEAIGNLGKAFAKI